MPLYVALEGPHGAGKSEMADALADALSDVGIAAEAFHHDRPHEYASAWESALFYAQERANITTAFPCDDAPRVLVCDRWCLSTWLDLAASQDGPLRTALQRLCHAEDGALPQVRYIILDAPREEIHARILARGEVLDADAIDALSDRYRRFAHGTGAPIVDTSAPRADVVAQLVEIVRGWL
jgi:thymidylate kinase